MSMVASRDYCLNQFVATGAKISPNAIKPTFENIIGSSPLMRLTASSFDKLFELMVGVFKYQVSNLSAKSIIRKMSRLF